LSIYTSGRDVKNFPKPNEFWPHRWTRDAGGNYKGVFNPFACLPFAMGARSCIGRKIADTQMALTMAKVRCSDCKHYKIWSLHLVLSVVRYYLCKTCTCKWIHRTRI